MRQIGTTRQSLDGERRATQLSCCAPSATARVTTSSAIPKRYHVSSRTHARTHAHLLRRTCNVPVWGRARMAPQYAVLNIVLSLVIPEQALRHGHCAGSRRGMPGDSGESPVSLAEARRMVQCREGGTAGVLYVVWDVMHMTQDSVRTSGKVLTMLLDLLSSGTSLSSLRLSRTKKRKRESKRKRDETATATETE